MRTNSKGILKIEGFGVDVDFSQETMIEKGQSEAVSDGTIISP